jgi:quercetin dioxygenase-like cupin family protein
MSKYPSSCRLAKSSRARQFVAITLSLMLSCLAALAADDAVSIKEIFRRDHPELRDKEIVVVRIELQPGASSPPHAHRGMITGYVEAGKLEFQLKGEALKVLKAGDTFFEPPGSNHMVARNPDSSAKTVVIAFVVNSKGSPLSTPLGEH